MGDVIRHYDEIQFFDFGGDNRARTDCRCWTVTFLDVREALQKIAVASPPTLEGLRRD